MSITAQSEDAFLTGPAASGEGRRGPGRRICRLRRAAWAPRFSWLFLAMPPGTLGSSRDVLSIPVEVSLGDDIKPAKKAEAAELPQQASQSAPSSAGRERRRAVGERTARRARRQAQGLGRVAPARRRDDERRQRLRANDDDRGQRGDGGRACRRQGPDQGSGDAQVESRFEGPERGRFLGADPRARGKRRRGAQGRARRHAALGRSRLSRDRAQREERRADVVAVHACRRAIIAA